MTDINSLVDGLLDDPNKTLKLMSTNKKLDECMGMMINKNRMLMQNEEEPEVGSDIQTHKSYFQPNLGTDEYGNEYEEDKIYNDEKDDENNIYGESYVINENDYQTFFKTMLKRKGISSPNELDAEEKKKFFAMVKKEWNKKKEGM